VTVLYEHRGGHKGDARLKRHQVVTFTFTRGKRERESALVDFL